MKKQISYSSELGRSLGSGMNDYLVLPLSWLASNGLASVC
jgi:hypothetical protein